MRKTLAVLVLALGLGMAQTSLESLRPTLAAVGGTQGFGLEASLLVYRPPVGEVRPSLALTYTLGGGLGGALLVRYFYPVAEGFKAGAGLGVGFPGPSLYARGEVEYDLAPFLQAPVFLGGDLGVLGGGLAAQLKLGYRF